MAFATKQSSLFFNNYPFTSQIPFPSNLIESARFGLKRGNVSLGLVQIDSQPGSLQIAIGMSNGYPVGELKYTRGNLWMTVDNQAIFGFIKLAVSPTQTFAYSGFFPLHKSTYLPPQRIPAGIVKPSLYGVEYEAPQVLEIQMAGDVQVYKDYEGFATRPRPPYIIQHYKASDGKKTFQLHLRRDGVTFNSYERFSQGKFVEVSKIGVLRSDQSLYGYTDLGDKQLPPPPQPAPVTPVTPVQPSTPTVIKPTVSGLSITSVNGAAVYHLNISGKDPVIVSGPDIVTDGLAVIYVDAGKQFPTCQRQQSDSGSGSEK